MLPVVPQHPSSPQNSTTSNASLCHETSGLAAPELQDLSPHDIAIIDAVIERAGPSATTFFTVFKAYSEVLKERGLDPQEVVYYGKLLKLGTLRGKNWGEKWALVRSQMGQVCQFLWNKY
jgi:protein SFI1